MAAIAITLAPANWLKGAAHIFADLTVPADGAIATLASDAGSGFKTFDATESPNGIYLGCMNDLKWSSSQEASNEFCDNLSSPIAVIPGQTVHTVEFMLKAILSQTIMAKLFATITQTITTTTKIQGGSVSVFPTMALGIVGRMFDDPTKYWYQMFYNASQVNAMSADQYKINALAKVPVKFQCKALSGRVPGKDVFEFVHTI